MLYQNRIRDVCTNALSNVFDLEVQVSPSVYADSRISRPTVVIWAEGARSASNKFAMQSWRASRISSLCSSCGSTSRSIKGVSQFLLSATCSLSRQSANIGTGKPWSFTWSQASSRAHMSNEGLEVLPLRRVFDEQEEALMARRRINLAQDPLYLLAEETVCADGRLKRKC